MGTQVFLGRVCTSSHVLDQKPIGSCACTLGGIHGVSSVYTSRRGRFTSMVSDCSLPIRPRRLPPPAGCDVQPNRPAAIVTGRPSSRVQDNRPKSSTLCF